MKKIVNIILICNLLVLTSCSPHSSESSAEKGPIEVEMWSLFTGGDLAYMESLIDGFNNSQEKYEVVMPAPSAADDYYTKVVTSVAANRGPDIAISHASKIPELFNQGLTKDLNELAESADLDLTEVNENILETLKMEDDKYHALAIDTHPTVMYFNTDLLEEADLVDEEGNIKMEKTPEGFIDFFQKAQEELPDIVPAAVPSSGYDVFTIWWAFYFQMGGTPIYSDDLREPEVTMDKDIAIEAAEYVRRLFQDEEVIPLNLTDPYEQFQTNRALSLITGVWGTGVWETDEEFNFKAMPVPQLFEKPATYGDSHTLFIPNQGSTTDEKATGAVEFMKYLHENEAEWSQAGHIPANDEVVDSEEFNELPYRSDYAEVVEDVEQPSGTIYSNMSIDTIMRNLDEIWNGRETPEDGINNLEKELDDLVK
ncbi:multiple sugar transport system substrate-binding protein [Salibacterium salarium]|uniref:extracellular solute-binding protein n=1 Tax=Salibacterium salarium TaxID=284579 RepID=UPI002784EBAE|nr:extracellular solute-binding protein [Salibacterium salarium]MDQ0299294.1 multiple sugar transport system substrate-binding protein [Salibacterium salarium]